MTTTLFPYATLQTEPLLRFGSPTVDGEPAPLLHRENRVDLSQVPNGWNEARLTARVQVPVEELESIGVRHYGVVLTVHCGPTNLRSTIALEPSGGESSGQWTGTLDLPRMVLRERASVYATVAGTVDGVPHRWLGRSREIPVDLQPPRIPEITGGHVPVEWRDFSKAEAGQNPIDPSLHDEISFTDMSLPEGPVIYLNERVAGLRRLLDVRTGRRRAERAVRELALDLIAVPSIVAMANVALAAGDPSGEGRDVQWPDTDWQRDVLRTLLPLMYPDREPDAALATALRGLAGGEDAQDVQSRLLGAAGRLAKSTPHVLGVVRAMEAMEEEV